MDIMKDLNWLLEQLREELDATSQAVLDAISDHDVLEATFLLGRESALGFQILQIEEMLEG